MTNRQQLEDAIAALEAQRETLGDAVVDASITALRRQLTELGDVAPDEQRKQVTVLFADLAGWTKLAAGLDPEDVRQIQSAYFKAVTPAIRSHAGAVEKYIGDAVLAVFGLPRAREQDPENAVRAALAMQAALVELNETLATQWGLNLGLRVGVHTGLVLATVGQQDDDFLVTGDTVNLASRLEGAALPGGVLISQATYRHVVGRFELQALAPLTVKGKQEPLQAYLVQGVRSRRFQSTGRGVEGITTRLIGRHAELHALNDALRSTINDRKLRIINLLGEAGVGKSRLLAEFEARESVALQVFRGRAVPEIQAAPYALLRDLFAAHCRIQESDPEHVVWDKLETGVGEKLAEDGDGSMKAQFIGQLLGYDFSGSPHLQEALGDGQQIRDRGRLYLVAFFRAMAERGPVLILLEDLHWADESSLEALRHLAGQLAEHPMLIIAAARPAFLRRHPEWETWFALSSRLELAPLSSDSARDLVNEILQRVDRVPDALQDLVTQRAEGNPFYVEELIKMLIERRVIIVEGDRWQVDLDHLADARVPATLTGVLQARLDRLAAEERTTLQQAAVVGRRFWDGTVRHLQQNAAATTGDLERQLDELQRREMVFLQSSSTFQEAREFLFKHALLRDVTYESVLKRQRRTYHGLVADWLISRRGGRADEVDGMIGDHLERAARTVEAADYLARAAREAAGRYANQEAIAYYRRAIALLEPHVDRSTERSHLTEWLEELGDVLGLLRHAGPAQEVYRQAREALRADDRVAQARLHRKEGDYYDQLEPRQQAYAQAATTLGEPGRATEGGWWAEWIDLQISRIWLYYTHDHPAEIDALEEQVRPFIHEKGTPAQQLNFSRALLARDNRRDRFVIPAERVVRVQEDFKKIQALGNARAIANQRFSLGFALLWHGDLRAAAAELDRAFQGAQAVGDGWTQTAALVYLSICHRLQGDVIAVRDLAPRCISLAEGIGLAWYIGAARAQQAWLTWREGDQAKAETLATSALQEMTHSEYPFRWLGLLPLAACQLDRGDLEGAIVTARQLDEPLQHPLPAGADAALQAALAAWDVDNGEAARSYLEAMIEGAKAARYL